MDIKDVVDSTVRKYKTRNPYELSDLLHIQISRCELGSIRGYYLKKYRIKQIILNHNLNYADEKFVLSHELGHAIMHPGVNTPFLKENTYLSTNKYEIEANTFAAELLIPDSIILENPGMTKNQIARLTGYDEKIMEFKKI